MNISKHIAITANTSWYIFNFRSNLIRALIAEGHRVTAIAPEDEYSEKLKSLGCQFEHINISQRGTNPFIDSKTCLGFYRLFQRISPDIVFNFTPKNNIYSTLAASRLNVPCVNNIAGLGSVFIEEGVIARVARWLYRISQKHAKTVFFQNDEDMNLMLRSGYVTTTQAQRLPGSGVDLMRFKVSPKKHDNGKLVFLLVARMLYQKGVSEYVDTAAKIKEKFPDTEFRLLGFIDTKNPSAIPEHVIRQWDREGTIHYLGTSDRVEDEIAEADCIVLPSYYREGVPRSLLEGAAMGKPLITTDNVGCRDTVDDGINGYLCKPRDQLDLQMKIEQLLKLTGSQWQDMGKRSREKIEREFDERIVINAYLNCVL